MRVGMANIPPDAQCNAALLHPKLMGYNSNKLSIVLTLQTFLNWESWDPPLVGSSPSHIPLQPLSYSPHYHPLFSCW